MVDAGEEPDHAAQREFLEETMDSEQLEPKDLEDVMKIVRDMFTKGKMVNGIGILYPTRKTYQNVICCLRFTKDTLTILEIPTTHGWRRRPLIVTPKTRKLMNGSLKREVMQNR